MDRLEDNSVYEVIKDYEGCCIKLNNAISCVDIDERVRELILNFTSISLTLLRTMYMSMKIHSVLRRADGVRKNTEKNIVVIEGLTDNIEIVGQLNEYCNIMIEAVGEVETDLNSSIDNIIELYNRIGKDLAKQAQELIKIGDCEQSEK